MGESGVKKAINQICHGKGRWWRDGDKRGPGGVEAKGAAAGLHSRFPSWHGKCRGPGGATVNAGGLQFNARMLPASQPMA
jgi:hypothetical protein